MRRTILALTLSAATIAVSPAGALAQTTFSFEAKFKETFGRAASKPCDHFLCGEGIVVGFGPATSTLDVVTFEPIAGTNCADITLARVLTLSDGSTVSLDEEGVVCFPGNSFFAPGAQRSFGNPGTFEGMFTVSGGTGAFAGASGSGSSMFRAAGDAGHSALSGTLTLP